MKLQNTPPGISVSTRCRISLTGGAVAASVFRRAASSVLAGAFLRAILAEGVHRAQLAAVGSTVSGRADAGAVHWRALRVVLAVAAILAILAIRIKGTWSRASLAVPAHLAGALSCPGMTQLRVLALALANLRTNIRSITFNFIPIIRRKPTTMRISKKGDSPSHNRARTNRPRTCVGCRSPLSSHGRICRYH